MRKDSFKTIIYLFVFILSFTNIMKNLYNADNSLILDSNTILKKLALNQDSTDYYGITSSMSNFMLKLMIPIVIFIFGIVSIYNSSNKTPAIVKVLLVISILQYIYNTYKFNMQDNGNVCYINHTSLITNYTDKKIFYLSHLYKLIYLVGLIIVCINYQSISSVLLYFIVGILIQLIGSLLYEYSYEYLYEDKKESNDLEFEDIIDSLKCAINNQFGINIYILIITIYIYLYTVNYV